MLDRVKDSVSRRARRLSRHSISALRSSSRDSPSTSQQNSPRNAATEFPQHPGVNPTVNKPLPHRPNIETRRRSFDDQFTEHPVKNPLNSGPTPRSPVLESPRQSLTAHRGRPSTGGHDEALNFSEIISEHPALNPLGSELAPRNENRGHSRNSSAAFSQSGEGRGSTSYERNPPRSSSDTPQHMIHDQYVPQRSGSRRHSQASSNAPPLEESLKKPLPLEPIQSGQTPMEYSSTEPMFPEPVSRKPVPMEPTPETTAEGDRGAESTQTRPARSGSIPGAWPVENAAPPPPVEVSAEIIHHVDTALPHLTSNAEESSTSSSPESNALDNEQHYKLVNEDNFHATTQDVVAKETVGAGTEYRAPEVADFDSSRNHRDIYFDHEVHQRNAAVHEEIQPHIHTIYQPKRTRSIHYHEHRHVIQPISDPEPIVKPAAHWAEDHRTGEIFKIPDALGEQILAGAYEEFKRIDGCNAYGSEADKFGHSEVLQVGGEDIPGTRSVEHSNPDALKFLHEQREASRSANTTGNLEGSSHMQSSSMQERNIRHGDGLSKEFGNLNINDQSQGHRIPGEGIIGQHQESQQHGSHEQRAGRSITETGRKPDARRASLSPDPRQTSPPPVRDFRIQRPSLVPDV